MIPSVGAAGRHPFTAGRCSEVMAGVRVGAHSYWSALLLPRQGENRHELATPQPLANIGEIPLSGGCSPQRQGRNLAAVVCPVFALQRNHPLQRAVTPSYQGRDPALGVLKARCSQVGSMARGLQLPNPPLSSQTTLFPKHLLLNLATWWSSSSPLSLRSVEEVPAFDR